MSERNSRYLGLGRGENKRFLSDYLRNVTAVFGNEKSDQESK